MSHPYRGITGQAMIFYIGADGVTVAAGEDAPMPVEAGFEADARTGVLASLDVTLSDTPGTVTVITLPDTARGIRLYPYTTGARFAIGEAPEAVGASSATTIAATAFNVGGIAQADQWEVRLIEPGTDRTLQLRSTAVSPIVSVEVF